MWILWPEFTSHRTEFYLVLEVSVKMTHDGSWARRGAAWREDVSIVSSHQNTAVTTCGACGYGAMIDEANCPPTLPCRKKTLQKRFSIISVVKDLCNNWWSFCGHLFICCNQPTLIKWNHIYSLFVNILFPYVNLNVIIHKNWITTDFSTLEQGDTRALEGI